MLPSSSLAAAQPSGRPVAGSAASRTIGRLRSGTRLTVATGRAGSTRAPHLATSTPTSRTSCIWVSTWKLGIFFVFAKGLRAQRAGRVAPRRGGAKRRAAALGAAQRRKAPPQAAERRAAHKAWFSAFNFPPIIEKQKMLTGTSAGIRPVLQLRRSLGTELHGYTIK